MKKNIYLLLFIAVFLNNACAQGNFVTIWDTRLPGVTGANEIEYIFVQRENWGSYKHSKFKVSWEQVDNPSINGSIELEPDKRVIKFPKPGIYKITYKVTPLNKDPLKRKGEYSLKRFTPKDLSSYEVIDMSKIKDDASKLLELTSWGEVHVSGACFFYNCENMDVSATDFPYKYCEFGTGMFYNCKNLKGNSTFNYWNIDENVDYMFFQCEKFNTPLDRWDLSDTKKMEFMFYGAKSFNQDISSWDVSNAYTLAYIFKNAESFNQNISNWDISGVIKNYADRGIPIGKDSYNKFEETHMFGEESKFPSSYKPRVLSIDGSNKGKNRHCVEKIAKRHKNTETYWKYCYNDLGYYNSSLSSGNIEMIKANRAKVLQSLDFVISNLGLLRWDIKDCTEAKSLADKYLSVVEEKQREMVKLKEDWSKKTEIKFDFVDALLVGLEAALKAY
jgi:surface protein